MDEVRTDFGSPIMNYVHEVVVAEREPVQIGSDVAALNIVNFAAIRNFDTNMSQSAFAERLIGRGDHHVGYRIDIAFRSGGRRVDDQRVEGDGLSARRRG